MFVCTYAHVNTTHMFLRMCVHAYSVYLIPIVYYAFLCTYVRMCRNFAHTHILDHVCTFVHMCVLLAFMVLVRTYFSIDV